MSLDGKIKFLTIAISFLFILIWVRLFYWQVVRGESLAVDAEAQHFFSLNIPPKRGNILFKDSSELVSSTESYLLYVHLPELKTDKAELADKLAVILAPEIPFVATPGAEVTPTVKEAFITSTRESLKEKILDRLNIKNSLWVNLAHFVPRGTKDQIEKLGVKGLGFAPEETRDYPEASMAAHLIGFVGADQAGFPKGYFGLEGYYERELAGSFGARRVEKDAFGRPIAIGEETLVPKKDGNSLLTSLDRSIQYFVEKHLEKGISDWQAKGGTAIVMDPNDGAILALANYPKYDPKNFSYYPTSTYKNPAIADLYEPGSVLKPLVMAAAINEGKLTPDTRCPTCSGPRTIGGYTVRTFNNQYRPNLTMTEVLINSDNTGMIYVGESLGFTKLHEYLRRFGFGQKTGVDLEEEEEGSLRPPADYYPIDQATLTFGQGIAANSLQVARAMSAIANGGYLVRPYLVTKVTSSTEDFDLKRGSGIPVISKETSKLLTEMLVAVTEGSPVHFPRDRVPELKKFKIAAKSGTAQIALGGKYKESGTIASVVGFFPANKPRFLILVRLNEPEVRPWGSDTAGPVFMAIAKDLITYYGLTP